MMCQGMRKEIQTKGVIDHEIGKNSGLVESYHSSFQSLLPEYQSEPIGFKGIAKVEWGCVLGVRSFWTLGKVGKKMNSSGVRLLKVISLFANFVLCWVKVWAVGKTDPSRVERLKEENKMLKELKSVHSTVDSDEPVIEKEKSSKQGRKIADIDADIEFKLEKAQHVAYNLNLDHQEKVLSRLDINDEEPADVEEVLEVIKAAKLITKVVTTAGVDVNAASVQDTPITAAKATKMIVPRRRRGVIIQDPEETTTTVTMQPKVQLKDKGKAILIEEPKPLKRQAQIKLDEEVAKQLEAELNADINWNVMIKQVKRSERLSDAVIKYQALKRKPLTEAQARRNMIVYLKNIAGYKMDYFKGMSYDEIRPLFEKHYNYNQAFLNEANEEVKVPDKEVSQEKEVEVESSKRKDATPLASKILITDCKIHTKRNRPYFKIIRADGNHKLFLSFSTMLKNFDSEDLESLWNIVRERFVKTEPNNYSDDFLLNTLKIMFENRNVEANVWKRSKREIWFRKG
nr:hypothetical protein [Tanacetum cinerariifolium]